MLAQKTSRAYALEIPDNCSPIDQSVITDPENRGKLHISDHLRESSRRLPTADSLMHWGLLLIFCGIVALIFYSGLSGLAALHE